MEQSGTNSTRMVTDNYSSWEVYYEIHEVTTWLIITIGLILAPVAICAVSSLVRKDNVAPIYVINLLISDIGQVCCLILYKTNNVTAAMIGVFLYFYFATASVGFMLCIAMERYVAIVWPLWYRTRRTVRMSLVVCALVWTFPLFLCILYIFLSFLPESIILFSLGIFLLLPFPLLIFFLIGTIKALSVSVSVRSEEKRRIVGLLILVLLIYTLLFLPGIVFLLVEGARDFNLGFVFIIIVKLNPVADMFLYIFLRKGAVNQVLFCLCCCRKNRTSCQPSNVTDQNTVNSV